MSSSVFYRFKSQKEPSRVAFDGTGISVFELKKEIIIQSKLGDGTDFELTISAEDSNEIYEDDTSIIPRSTTVVAKRLPAGRPGRGGAARYVSGKMPQNSRASRQQPAPSQGHPNTSKSSSAVAGTQSEDERIAATLQLGADDWAQQSQQLANVAPVYRPGLQKSKIIGDANRPLPQGYICNRCGEKGHWIWDCPTNNDPAYDNRPRIKRTTGIPKSFLKTIEKPTTVATDGTTDDQRQPTGVMVNSEGEWVVAEPDQAAWDKYQAQAKTSAAAQDAAAQGSEELQRQGLECRIDRRLFVDPTTTPCCDTTFCHECIQNALLDNDLRCPQCHTENILINDLRANDEMQAKVRRYRETTMQSNRDVGTVGDGVSGKSLDEAAPSATDSSSQLKVNNGSSYPPRSPRPVPAKGIRKRAAETSLEADRAPKSPKPSPIAPGNPSSPKTLVHEPTASQDPTASDVSAAKLTNTGDMSNFMGMGMPFNMGLPNPLMMNGASMMAPAWSGQAWAMAQNPFFFPGGLQQPMIAFGPGLTTQGYGAQANGQATATRFANQQRSNNEEDSAYIRRPVNPNRQNRRNWPQRPPDYREI